jgi:hypothetical protein
MFPNYTDAMPSGSRCRCSSWRRARRMFVPGHGGMADRESVALPRPAPSSNPRGAAMPPARRSTRWPGTRCRLRWGPDGQQGRTRTGDDGLVLRARRAAIDTRRWAMAPRCFGVGPSRRSAMALALRANSTDGCAAMRARWAPASRAPPGRIARECWRDLCGSRRAGDGADRRPLGRCIDRVGTERERERAAFSQ